MERSTIRDKSGYYLTGDGIYGDWGVPEKFRGADVDRLAAYEDTKYKPTEIKSLEAEWNVCRSALDSYRAVGTVKEFRTALRRIAEDDKAREEGRLVELPCKVSDAIDTLFSHNDIIALWYDRPDDKHHSYLLWRGEAWKMPKEYGNQRVLKFKGIVSEKISESDTINLQVTPYITPARQEAEAALGGGEGD